MFTGQVFKRVDKLLGDITVEDTPDYLICKVFVGGIVVIQFPMAKGVDSNTVALRVGNVVNQTGLVDYPVRVEVSETP